MSAGGGTGRGWPGILNSRIPPSPPPSRGPSRGSTRQCPSYVASLLAQSLRGPEMCECDSRLRERSISERSGIRNPRHAFALPSLRGAKRRSNPDPLRRSGLLRLRLAMTNPDFAAAQSGLRLPRSGSRPRTAHPLAPVRVRGHARPALARPAARTGAVMSGHRGRHRFWAGILALLAVCASAASGSRVMAQEKKTNPCYARVRQPFGRRSQAAP
jgi:hypothetical protein